jgi:FkbM family methyltransferase
MNWAWKAVVRAYPFSRGRIRLINLARRKVTGIIVAGDRFGNRLLLDLDNHVDCMTYLTGGYEWDEVNCLAAHAARRGCTHFVDVGANMGVYSLFFARRAEIKHIWAFEPDPRNHAQLIANLWLNRLHDRVKVSDVALSSEDGTTTFYVFTAKRNPGELSFNTSTSSLIQGDPKLHTPIEVQTRRMDGMLALRGKNVLIKVDVEGAEPMVLAGAREFLMGNRCLLMLEIWSHPADAVEKTTEMLRQMGYGRVAADIGGDNYLFENNVAAAGA